ncbi:MAG TPA: protoporphyrinogen oxidase [Propionibacteriaceae bacterium]|nr:protoporphyrinogen oxidase [Propionibacteriaceae bacterium]
MRLLVVGGGITGLAAAWEAVRRDEPVEVVLLEASDRLGGKLWTEHDGGVLYEHGPDSFVSYRPAGVQLVKELGLEDQLIRIRGARSVSLRARGRLRPLPQGMGMVLPTRLWPFVTTRILSPLDKVRAALDLVLPRQLTPGRDEAIGTLLRKRLGAGIVRRFADPMVGGIYGASVDDLSLDAVLPSLRADETAHRSLLLAALAQGRKARSTSRGPSSPFATLRDGLGSLVDTLVDQLRAAGATLRTGSSVESLVTTGAGGVTATLAGGEQVSADAVVIAAGVATSARLLADVAPEASVALDAVPLATSTVVNLVYPVSAFPEPPTGQGWLEGEAAPISGVTISSSKWEGRAPDDLVLIRAFVPQRLGPVALAPDDELVARVTAHLADVMGVRTDPVVTRVTRWRSAMPVYTVGHLDRVATVERALADLPTWRVAGSAVRGVGIPDCIADGRRQAALALDAAQTSVPSASTVDSVPSER